MKLKLAALTLLSVAMFCGESNADLLGRMMGRGNCDGCQTTPTCCDTPAPSCDACDVGCDANIGRSCRLFHGCHGGCGLFSGGCGSGCGDECGTGCGRGRGRGLFSKHFSGGCGSCCDAPEPCAAPAPAPCTQPVSDCGCEGGSNCGCGMKLHLRGRLCGLFSRVGNKGCGCEDAPVCGCDSEPAPAPSCGCGDSGCKTGLLSRLHSRHHNRCDDGCNAPYPNSGCSNCGGGCVDSSMMPGAAPTQAEPMIPVPESSEGNVDPPAAEGAVPPAADGANRGIAIDPDAFVIKS